MGEGGTSEEFRCHLSLVSQLVVGERTGLVSSVFIFFFNSPWCRINVFMKTVYKLL